METKKCLFCGTEFSKPQNESRKNWETRHKFCSRECIPKYTWQQGKGKTQFVKGMVAPNKGKVYTEEQKKGMKLFEKGHTKVGTEHLKKWRENGGKVWNKGVYGYHTHGGCTRTQFRLSIRQSQKYINWRTEVFKRDDWTCVWCGKRGKTLHADHIKQFALIIKENDIKSLDEAYLCNELWELNNGRTLCKECHSKTESYQKLLKT